MSEKRRGMNLNPYSVVFDGLPLHKRQHQADSWGKQDALDQPSNALPDAKNPNSLKHIPNRSTRLALSSRRYAPHPTAKRIRSHPFNRQEQRPPHHLSLPNLPPSSPLPFPPNNSPADCPWPRKPQTRNRHYRPRNSAKRTDRCSLGNCTRKPPRVLLRRICCQEETRGRNGE